MCDGQRLRPPRRCERGAIEGTTRTQHEEGGGEDSARLLSTYDGPSPCSTFRARLIGCQLFATLCKARAKMRHRETGAVRRDAEPGSGAWDSEVRRSTLDPRTQIIDGTFKSAGREPATGGGGAAPGRTLRCVATLPSGWCVLGATSGCHLTTAAPLQVPLRPGLHRSAACSVPALRSASPCNSESRSCSNHKHCSTMSHRIPSATAPPPPPPPPPPPLPTCAARIRPDPLTVTSLLAQRAAITNWDQYAAANNVSGWSAGSSPCEGWGGVACLAGAVVAVKLSCEPPGCTVKAQGSLAPQLAGIRRAGGRGSGRRGAACLLLAGPRGAARGSAQCGRPPSAALATPPGSARDPPPVPARFRSIMQLFTGAVHQQPGHVRYGSRVSATSAGLPCCRPAASAAPRLPPGTPPRTQATAGPGPQGRCLASGAPPAPFCSLPACRWIATT